MRFFSARVSSCGFGLGAAGQCWLVAPGFLRPVWRATRGVVGDIGDLDGSGVDLDEVRDFDEVLA